jgi:hypothetical protein
MFTPRRRCWRGCNILCLVLSAAVPAVAQVTDDPDTIPPGKVLVKMDGLTLSLDHQPAGAAGNTYKAVGVASTLVSFGLTRSLDAQVGFQLYSRQEFTTAGNHTSHSGLGDLAFRTKWTFWRDDAAGAAAAIIPYVKVPSNTGGVGNRAVEGGLILPWKMSIAGALSAGAMLQWDFVRNDDDNGYDSRWFASGFVQRNLTGSLAIYGEGSLAMTSTGWSKWQASIGAGVLWNVTRRLQLDYEITRGLNDRTLDWVHVWRATWEW